MGAHGWYGYATGFCDRCSDWLAYIRLWHANTVVTHWNKYGKYVPYHRQRDVLSQRDVNKRRFLFCVGTVALWIFLKSENKSIPLIPYCIWYPTIPHFVTKLPTQVHILGTNVFGDMGLVHCGICATSPFCPADSSMLTETVSPGFQCMKSYPDTWLYKLGNGN